MMGLLHVSRRLGGRPVLRDVSLELRSGEGLALHGANGAGKTTVWRILAGLLRPHGGRVLWQGRPLGEDDWPAARARTGVVGHALMAQPALSGMENLVFFARLNGVPAAIRASGDWLARVGLVHVAERPLGTYSRGQRQRFALARAFLHEPDVALLDEPFAGLDTSGAALLEELLAEHYARGGAALVIDHDEDRAARITSRSVRLAGGRVDGAAGDRP